ncbi:uncharacterized protein G2W53_033949 [Senna tora]|uniref:Uncharacterized protein n=1 Tax=Senna tora TaxID=362788 RepID=A0A834W8Z4_9FABA|nr:uncharacterized protein G2W53_033949 [Senna tora]
MEKDDDKNGETLLAVELRVLME